MDVEENYSPRRRSHGSCHCTNLGAAYRKPSDETHGILVPVLVMLVCVFFSECVITLSFSSPNYKMGCLIGLCRVVRN